MTASHGLDRIILGFLFVSALIVDGVVLFFVEPPWTRLLFGLGILLPLMWPVVWTTRHFGLLAIMPERATGLTRQRRFLRLRALTVQLVEDVKRLNWLSVDARRGIRSDDAVAADLEALTQRLHDLVDQMPAAAGLGEPGPRRPQTTSWSREPPAPLR